MRFPQVCCLWLGLLGHPAHSSAYIGNSPMYFDHCVSLHVRAEIEILDEVCVCV
jgi:hypothetical protein